MSDDLDALAGDLAEFDVEKKPAHRSALEERLVAGFEDIQRFVEKVGHAPRHDTEHDIFERLYAVRLARLADSSAYRALLVPLDHQGLLTGEHSAPEDEGDEFDMDALASDLEDLEAETSITSHRCSQTTVVVHLLYDRE
jgi:H2-forming N5,N10-methylenetetrahydromethanopterin dehydrogenase-like enzyme